MVAYAIAFIVSAVVSSAELASKYKQTMRYALLNYWAIPFIVINGIFGSLVYLLITEYKVGTFGITEPYIQALLAGLEWQVIIRIKLFTYRSPNDKETPVGIETLYRLIADVFETGISQYEESKLYDFICPIREQYDNVEEVRTKVLDFIRGRAARGKIDKIERDENIRYVTSLETTDEIFLLVVSISSISMLRKMFPL